MTVEKDQVEHFSARKHFHRAEADLAAERLIRAKQQLLAGLSARVERARHLRSAEGTIIEITAVLAREGNALRDALINDVPAHLGEAINIGFARAKIAPLDRVVEKPVNAVAIVLVILGGVDAALGGDAVRAARTVLETEALDLVTQLGQSGRRRCARESGADDEDVKPALVRRVDELHLETVFVPLLRERARRNVRVQFHVSSGTKHQIPSSNHQRSSKPQTSIDKQARWHRTKRSEGPVRPAF